jgi:hypothetical protein
MDQINSPFSPEQVARLFEYQLAYQFHPFTCAHRGDGKHLQIGSDLGMLIPTVRGWICPFCDYRQDWAHSFMAGNHASS